MRRRALIAGLGGALAWPVASWGQQRPAKIRHLGLLQPGTPPARLVEAMRGRLRELGYTEGRDLVLDYRWAEGKLERLTQFCGACLAPMDTGAPETNERVLANLNTVGVDYREGRFRSSKESPR